MEKKWITMRHKQTGQTTEVLEVDALNYYSTGLWEYGGKTRIEYVQPITQARGVATSVKTETPIKKKCCGR